MDEAFDLNVVRVFTDELGGGGNLLGLFLDEPVVPEQHRQAIAARLAFSETVFFEDSSLGSLRIFTPTRELPFAGHPLVGAAWLLGTHEARPAMLLPPAGEVSFGCRQDGAWIGARAADSPAWEHVQLPDEQSIEALTGPPGASGHVQAWAWEDQSAGRIRARVFASDYGVPEDPATGSAAIALCAQLARELFIIQGRRGEESEITVRPIEGELIELGGRVVLDRPCTRFELSRLR